MTKAKKKKQSLKDKLLIFGLTGGLLTAVIGGCSTDETNKLFVEQYQNKIFRNFDENKNGILEGEEIVKLAKACGYKEVIPYSSPSVVFESDGPENIYLCIYGNWHYTPIPVTKSKLEELAK